MAHWFLAASPMRRSESVKATSAGAAATVRKNLQSQGGKEKMAPKAEGARGGEGGRLTGRGGAVALVVGDDLDALILPVPDARVGGSEVDADGESLNLRNVIRAQSQRGDVPLDGAT
jgi:hypothetical protein